MAGAAMLVAYGVLITVFTLKFVLEGMPTAVCEAQGNWQQHSLVKGVCIVAESFIYHNSYFYACIALAAMCLAALLIHGSIFTARIVSNIRQGRHW